LIVAGERHAAAAKSRKDIEQSAQLIDLLADDRSTELRDAWRLLAGRGEECVRRCKAGIRRMEALHPSVAQKLAAIIA
jgi:hypothetical protein